MEMRVVIKGTTFYLGRVDVLADLSHHILKINGMISLLETACGHQIDTANTVNLFLQGKEELRWSTLLTEQF